MTGARVTGARDDRAAPTARRGAARAASRAPAGASWRLFLAVPVPAEAAESIHAALAAYRERHAARWSEPGDYHLTLVFLGAVDSAHAPRLSAIARDVAARERPFEVRTGSGGGVVRDADGVAWLRLVHGGRELGVLAQGLAERLPDEVGAGGRGPRRSPSAHLTVARRATRELVADLATSRLGPLEVAWVADRITLVRSHLERPRARHQVLDTAMLGERA